MTDQETFWFTDGMKIKTSSSIRVLLMEEGLRTGGTLWMMEQEGLQQLI